ncbi:MAG: cell division protein FtsZ [Rickettsiales bacterium]|jgi:cell division protein FtsZ|nr:cell division protein FtsZ [Rickettsiales bacterium]
MSETVQQYSDSFCPRITVLGLGGAGCNAVNSMVSAGISGADFIAANTDMQSMKLSKAQRKIQLGRNTTKGLGSGSKPEIGRAAAEESAQEIAAAIEGSQMLFLVAGLGGGTGSGALPVVAELARAKGILTAAIVTTPFDFEGEKRADISASAEAKAEDLVDCLIVLPNQNLALAADKNTPIAASFRMSDSIMAEGIRIVADLALNPGTINLDFADIRSVMENTGRAIICVATQGGEGRAQKAVEAALSNPVFAPDSIRGAKGILVNITGNPANLSLDEVGSIMNSIRAEAGDPATNIQFGICFDQNMGDELKVAVIATGIDGSQRRAARPAAALDSQAWWPPGGMDIGSFIEKEASRLGERPGVAESRASEPPLNKESPEPAMPFSGEPPVVQPKKRSPLSDFLGAIGGGLADDERMEPAMPMPGTPEPPRENDNVVFLDSSLDIKTGGGDRQFDLLETIKKMEETLGLPQIFNK